MTTKNQVVDTQQRNLKSEKKLSKIRLYLMRGLYLLTFLSLGYNSWLEIIIPSEKWGPYDGITFSFWAAYATLMGIGIRYPIKMLPLLLLQLFYKSVWLIGIAYPLWSTDQLDSVSADFLRPFLIAIPVDLIVIPWGYVWIHYIKGFFKFR
ncbi:hypothetical protein [Aquimarina algiphila]|uniref:hypothetical protein n=1 Tax=Aquimarina algiphila TaxID=2047982 RepID=UPI0024937B60|nr:hypothetical protein [Aquimarina algiphila]